MSEENVTPENPDTSQPAATPSATEAAFVNKDGSFVDNWTSSLGEDFKDDVETLGRYKTLPDLSKALMNAKRKIGADPESLVRIPTAASSEEEIAEFNKKIGVPESVEAYVYEPEKELLEAVGGVDEKKMEAFREFAHKELNLTPNKFQKLMDFYFNSTATEIKEANLSAEAQAKQLYEEGMTALKSRLGDTLPDVLNNVNALTERYGARELMTKHNLQNDPEFIGIFERIANDMSETRLKGLVSPSAGQTPAEIESKITELRNHPAYMDRSNPEHNSVRNQVTELYKKKVS